MMKFSLRHHRHSKDNFDKAFKDFIHESLEHKFRIRTIRKGAACHEFIKYVINLDPATALQSSDIALIWRSNGLTRISRLACSVAGEDNFSVEMAYAKHDVQFSKAEQLRKDIESCTHRLPVAICIDPGISGGKIADTVTPDWIDAYHAAGLLRGRYSVVAPCITQDLYIPVSCKLVYEGYIQKNEASDSESALRFHVTCITGQKGFLPR